MVVNRPEICRYTVDEDGTPFCGNAPKTPTAMAGKYCDQCGGLLQRTEPELVKEDDPFEQPGAEEIASRMDFGRSTGVDTTEIKPAPEWTELNPMLAWEAGKAGVHLEREAGVEIHLAEQKTVYERILLAGHGARLIQALLDRDRIIAQMSREVANGKMGGTLLREFVRACLADADRASDPQKLQDFLEQKLGAAKADRRQLREKGTTL